jgi:hypothetical protein
MMGVAIFWLETALLVLYLFAKHISSLDDGSGSGDAPAAMAVDCAPAGALAGEGLAAARPRAAVRSGPHSYVPVARGG